MAGWSWNAPRSSRRQWARSASRQPQGVFGSILWTRPAGDLDWIRPNAHPTSGSANPCFLAKAGLASSWVKIAPVPRLIASMRCPAPLLALTAALGACLCAAPAAMAAPDPSGQGGTKAMFATKAEAEAAAKQFHCQGAHKMGTMWMPCASHADATGTHSGPKAH